MHTKRRTSGKNDFFGSSDRLADFGSGRSEFETGGFLICVENDTGDIVFDEDSQLGDVFGIEISMSCRASHILVGDRIMPDRMHVVGICTIKSSVCYLDAKCKLTCSSSRSGLC